MCASDFTAIERLGTLSLRAATALDKSQRDSNFSCKELVKELTAHLLSLVRNGGREGNPNLINELNDLYKEVWSTDPEPPATVSQLEYSYEHRITELEEASLETSSIPSSISTCLAMHEFCRGRIQHFMTSENIEGAQ